jgi:hypothetical protein
VFLRYTVTWQDWSDAAVLPVKIFDVAACKVEYRVEECAGAGNDGGECVHVQTATQVLPRGGDVVFGVAHQHSGSIGASLHGDDGASPMRPTGYGEGQEAGNEAGYIVGMSTCYPKPGDVKVRDGEALTVVSRYSSQRRHTGAMGLFYILRSSSTSTSTSTSSCRPPARRRASASASRSHVTPKLFLNLTFDLNLLSLMHLGILRSETPQFSRH